MLVKFWQVLRWPPRRLVLWHTVAAVPMGTVVLLGAYLSYHYHQLALENRDRVDRAYEVLDVVDGLYIAVQNADVAQRDYIITGDTSHLAVFESSLKEESADSERLRVLLAASPMQETALSRLDSAVSAKLAELGRTIGIRQNQGFDAARQAIKQGDGGKAMDDIRQQVTTLGANERRFLMRRQAAGKEHERDVLLVGIFIAALSVTTRILIALWLKRMHAKRQAAAKGAEGEASPAGAAQAANPAN
jgi:CHASE3 domain sensor protein